jgi:ABC-type multidrug transport system ATPase subunit
LNGIEIIKGFDLDIMAGEVVCLLGNNGSGKTTLINMLTGLIDPDEESGDTIVRTERGFV